MAFTTMFDSYPHPATTVLVGTHATMPYPSPAGATASAAFELGFHPRPAFEDADLRVLSQLTLAPGDVSVAVTVVGGIGGTDHRLVRMDLTKLVRDVNHHFESYIDGHDRKYQLQVSVNSTATELHALHSHARIVTAPGEYHMAKGNHPNHGRVVSVHLIRKKDDSDIPYVTVHGVTLITMMRLGLLRPLVKRAYHQFVSLPLYEDMAPWNIVFLGPSLDYIDYDTRDHTYDDVVPKAYQIMEVLFNYKRTVEDFGECGRKASNPYNFPYVSDCVGSTFRGKCKDPALPVPCGDGSCQSDYVACLRVMSKTRVQEHRKKSGRRHVNEPVTLRDILAPTAIKELGVLDADSAGSDGKPQHLVRGEWKFGREGLLASQDDEEEEANKGTKAKVEK